MADWDLEAVVRGCCRRSNLSPPTPPATTTATETEMDPFAFFSQALLQEEDDHLLCFPDLLATQTCMQELEELCRPFYPNTPQPISPNVRSIPSTSSIKGHQNQQQQQQQKASQRPSNPQISRSKRRKNQQKRVVCEVPAEELSSDMWNWRKYGQKPIKGSPYPRGYYRCSTLKGCLARKQVERSRSDPTMFIITYTAEHNHPLPTHRNSLAGSTRNKCSAEQPSKAASASSGLSPTTPLTSSMEEDIFLQQHHHKQEGGDSKAEEELDEMTQMSDDMFLDLEEIRESTSTSGSFDDCLSDHFSSPWTSSFASTAASSGLIDR